MIDVYYGEFLVSPAPIVIEANRCSHNCFYCFANLNKQTRQFNPTTLKTLLNPEKHKTPLAYFLQNKYPILYANKTDPLSKTNEDITNTILDIAEKMGYNIFWQTKGGNQELQQRLVNLKPSVFYISLTGDKEDLIKQIEPGAPSYNERIDFINALIKNNHKVIVGLNPLIIDWWYDIYDAIDLWQEIGLTHIWVGYLHFNRFQKANFQKNILTKYNKWIEYGMDKTKTDSDILNGVIGYIDSIGMIAFDGVSNKYGFWNFINDIWINRLPTFDDFLAHLKSFNKPVVFNFDYFYNWLGLDKITPKVWAGYKNYIFQYTMHMNNRKERVIPKSYKEVLEFLWRWVDYPTILRHTNIYIACKDGKTSFIDKDNRDILLYSEDLIDSCEYNIPDDYIELIR